jgi:site-specific recombinase XerD
MSSQHIYVTTWLDNLDQQGKSHHTLAAYRRALEHFIRWSETAYCKPFDPGRAMARDVRDWKAYQQTVEKVAPATVNQRLVALSRFFAWAVQKDLSTEDPTTDVHALRLPPREPKGLDSREVRRLLRAAVSRRVHPTCWTLIIGMFPTQEKTRTFIALLCGFAIPELFAQADKFVLH